VSRRRLARGACLLATAALAAVLSGCNVGGPSTVTTSAVFSDVDNLEVGAQVQMADVPIGHVTGIVLDGSRARVTMVVDQSASVPDDVTAELAQTTLLGTWVVDLAAPTHRGPPLHTGEVIAHTKVVPDVEQLVSAGAQVFGAVSTSDLANIVAAGGQGFEGQAASLRQLLDDLSSVTAGYASRTAQITTTINSLNQLGTTMAPNSGADAQALTNLSQTVTALAAESGKFNGLLQSLDTVAVQGKTLIGTYLPQITDQLHALGAVAHQLAGHQQDLAGLLENLPVHDATVSSVARNDFIQVLENIIVCGIPGGGASSAPAFSCSPGSGG
jgi:phospholipid/cholesterol/gamma-HCH transport system substrate-binding protein